ncbi:oligosaccharide flippase family protein [Flavobacterium sp.]|uniref:oligosaccharide flippase family protein n=2 Tax=Flavobacterium sp. TaxID=239 RepID=UPI004048B9AE
MQINSILSKINSKFVVYGIGQAFNLLVPLVIAPYLIYVCNLDGFGKIGIAFSFALFLILIVDYGFDIKGIKRISESRNSPQKLQYELVTTLFTKFFLFFFSAILGFTCVYFSSYFFKEKELFIFTLTIVFAQVFNPIWFLQGIEDFFTSSILNACSKVLYVIFIYFFITDSNDYIYVNSLLGISSLVVNIGGLVYIFRKNNFHFFKPNLNLIFQILKNDFSLCISQLFLSIRQLSPLFLAGYIFGYGVAGQYKIIDQIISLYRTLSQVFLKFFYPQLCFRLNEDTKNALQYWKKYVFILFTGVVLSCLFLFFLSEEVLIFFRVELNIIKELKILFQLALIVPIAMVFSLSLEQLMFGIHNNKLYFKITLFVTIINLLTILIFSYFFNLKGIILSIFLSEILFVCLYYYGALKKIKNENQLL